MKKKAGAGAIVPQIKELQALPEARRGKEGFAYEVFGGSRAHCYLD